jgi:hypothetical protein
MPEFPEDALIELIAGLGRRVNFSDSGPTSGTHLGIVSSYTATSGNASVSIGHK